MVRRILLPLMLVLGLAPSTWLRSPLPPHNLEQVLHVAALPVPAQAPQLGPFRLTGAWVLSSPNTNFGGYSALVTRPGERLLAFSDRGYMLDFALPDTAAAPARLGVVPGNPARLRRFRDIEAATSDPRTGQIFLAMEGRNIITRHGPNLARQASREKPQMRTWRYNSGPEAMVRLPDGQFVVLCECNAGWTTSGMHPGLLFAGDPTRDVPVHSIVLNGAPGYRPTDLALLPDGRVLVLVRRLLWPAPARFAGKILLADPAQITAEGAWSAVELADLSKPLPVDNFEGLVVAAQADGSLAAWLISDENAAISQRVLLWKLTFRLDQLPPKQKAPGIPDALR